MQVNFPIPGGTQITTFIYDELDEFIARVIGGRSRSYRDNGFGPTHVIFGKRQQYLWAAWVLREGERQQFRTYSTPHTKTEIFGLTILHSTEGDQLLFVTTPR